MSGSQDFLSPNWGKEAEDWTTVSNTFGIHGLSCFFPSQSTSLVLSCSPTHQWTPSRDWHQLVGVLPIWNTFCLPPWPHPTSLGNSPCHPHPLTFLLL
jgi:hypothetical protein